MKRWFLLGGLVLISAIAIYFAQSRKVNTQASPDAIVYFIGSSEHELSRLPMAVTKMSDEDEIKIGDEIARYYVRESNNTTERFAQAYVEEVGKRVAIGAHRKLPYKFHYLPEENMVNAFSLPGGHVFIGQGLMNLMDSEDELAAVLGHELEHIDLGHCVERVQIEAKMRRLNLGVLSALASIPLEVFEAGYSKEQELAADREGTRLAVHARYSPQGAVRMFEAFEQLEPGHSRKPGSPIGEMTGASLQSLSEYFRTHPPSSMRAAELRKLIAEEKWPPVQETDLRTAYLRWNLEARRAFEQNQFQKAIELGGRSLKSQPRQSDIVRLVAQSRFMSADFRGAANDCMELFKSFPAFTKVEDERCIADSLNTFHSRPAVAEFERWAQDHGPDDERMALAIRIDRAGLRLVQHEPNEAGVLQLPNDEFSPEMLARLGTWYYRARDPEEALHLINQAIQLRPQNSDAYNVLLVWALIDSRRYADALGIPVLSNDRETSAAARATASWLSGAREQGLSSFNSLHPNSPWRNRSWIQGLYSPNAAQALEEMRVETERRKKVSR